MRDVAPRDGGLETLQETDESCESLREGRREEETGIKRGVIRPLKQHMAFSRS